MANKINIIRYSEQEHVQIAKAWLADLQDIERSVLPIRRPGKDMIEEYYSQTTKEVKENNGAILMAEVDGEPAGLISFFPERYHDVNLVEEANYYGYVTDVYVADKFRGTGVFQALLAKATEHLKKAGVTSIRLNVVAKNERARRAYEKEGFEAEEIEMRKRI